MFGVLAGQRPSVGTCLQNTQHGTCSRHGHVSLNSTASILRHEQLEYWNKDANKSNHTILTWFRAFTSNERTVSRIFKGFSTCRSFQKEDIVVCAVPQEKYALWPFLGDGLDTHSNSQRSFRTSISTILTVEACKTECGKARYLSVIKGAFAMLIHPTPRASIHKSVGIQCHCPLRSGGSHNTGRSRHEMRELNRLDPDQRENGHRNTYPNACLLEDDSYEKTYEARRCCFHICQSSPWRR